MTHKVVKVIKVDKVANDLGDWVVMLPVMLLVGMLVVMLVILEI